MKAIVVERPGGVEGLTLRDVEEPVLRADEIMISVVAAGVNRADILQRQGHYPPPPGASDILGLEVSGTVAAIGDAVTRWAVGDHVCALLDGGGYAERVAVPEAQVLPIPDGMPLVEAAALPEAVCTVTYNLFVKAALQPGEMVLIHGGASGIGTAAIQIAKAHGARVACTAGSREKLAIAERCGADIPINYKTEDFVARLGDAGGADVILDIIGAKYLARNVEALANGGRLAIIGLQGGRRAELDIARLLSRQGSLFATSLRALPAAGKAEIVARARALVWAMIEGGSYRPVIHDTLPLNQVAEAHRKIEESEVAGKIILTLG
jgi:putative PIG3 family NAD(P)H quinone oxidoreductase